MTLINARLDNSVVCGGPERGSCENIILFRNHKILKNIKNLSLSNDDRLNWPLTFYQFICMCKKNYFGISCDSCKPGWSGEDCNIRSNIKIRQNILFLIIYEPLM